MKKRKCPACKLGFNSKSKPVKCHGCDGFTHARVRCTSSPEAKDNFFCKICVPVSIDTNVSKDTENEKMEKTSSGWKCKICNLCVKTSYSMKRHITNQHIDLGSTVESPNSTPEAITAETEMTTAADCDLTQQEGFPPTPRREQTLNDLLKKENWKNYFLV